MSKGLATREMSTDCGPVAAVTWKMEMCLDNAVQGPDKQGHCSPPLTHAGSGPESNRTKMPASASRGSDACIAGAIHILGILFRSGIKYPRHWPAVIILHSSWHFGLKIHTRIWVKHESNFRQEKHSQVSRSFSFYPPSSYFL